MSDNKDLNADLERGSAASGAQGSSGQAFSTSKLVRQCAIAIQYLDGSSLLLNTNATEEAENDVLFGSAKEQIFQAFCRGWSWRRAGWLVTSVVVGTAKVRQVIHFESQSPDQSRASRLYLQDFMPDALLTEALYNPQLLFHSRNSFQNPGLLGSRRPTSDDKTLACQRPPTYQASQNSNTNNGVPMRDSADSDEREIIVVKRVIDRAKIAWLLVLLLLLSPALGLVVGVCSHDAEVGIAVSAGLFALASFVQGFVAWVQG